MKHCKKCGQPMVVQNRRATGQRGKRLSNKGKKRAGRSHTRPDKTTQPAQSQPKPHAASPAPLAVEPGGLCKKILPVDWGSPNASGGENGREVKRIIPMPAEQVLAQNVEQIVNSDRRVEIRVEVAWPGSSSAVKASPPSSIPRKAGRFGRNSRGASGRTKSRPRKAAVARAAKRGNKPAAPSRVRRRPPVLAQHASEAKAATNSSQIPGQPVATSKADLQQPQPVMVIKEPRKTAVPEQSSPIEAMIAQMGGAETASKRDSQPIEEPVDPTGVQERPEPEMKSADTPHVSPGGLPFQVGLPDRGSRTADEPETCDGSPVQGTCDATPFAPEPACGPAQAAPASEVACEAAPVEATLVEAAPEPGSESIEQPFSERTPALVENGLEAAVPEQGTGMGGGVVWTFAKRPDGQESRERKQVLVIDDDPVIRMLLTMGLGARGYECVTAENGKVAQELLQTLRPDVMIVDLLMPVMDGLSFLQWLRGEAGDTTPAVVLTNVSDPRIQEEARACGADAILCKPLQLSQLLEEMNKLVTA